MAGQGGGKQLSAAIAAGVSRDYAGAVRILERLISEGDPPAEAYLFLSRSHHALGNYPRAFALINDYLRIRPRSSQGYFFAGRTCLSLGRPHRAVVFLEKALSLQPGSPSIMAFLGSAYLKVKRSADAVEILEKAVLAAPENTRIYRGYINALLVMGIRLCRRESYDLGVQMLNFALENGVDSPLLRLELGRAYRETGFPGEALEQYDAAVEFAPDDLRIRWYRASVLMSLGQNAQAVREIDYIRSRGGDLPDLPWSGELVDRFMIRSFMETGEWRKAADAARIWLKTRHPDPMIHTMYAESLRNLGNLESAANHLDRALQLSPEELFVWYERLLVSWEREDWKSLKKILAKLQELGGDEDIIRKFTVLYESKSGKDERKTITLLQNAVRRFGPEPEIMYALAEQYLRVGLLEEALTWFRKTTAIQYRHERAHLGIISAAEALLNEGEGAEREALREAYGEYLSLWPDNRTIRRERALFLVHICEYAEASGELEQLLSWEPENPSLRRTLAYAYRKSERYREAAVFLKALLKERPGDVKLLLEYAGCLERAGSITYAEAVLEKAMIFLKDQPDIFLALGILYSKRKKNEKAFDMFREAAALDTGDHRPYTWMAAISRKMGDKDRGASYEKEAQRRKNGKK